MRAVFLVGLIASVSAQTSTVTASGDWSATTTWQSGLIPSLTTTTINIQSAAQVTVSSSLSLATTVALNLGTAGTAGTALILNGQSLIVTTFNHAEGELRVNGSAAAATTVVATFPAGASNRRIMGVAGGKFSLLALTGSASLDGSLVCDACTLDSNGRTWTINAGGQLTFNGSASVSSSATASGAGSVRVAGGANLSLTGSATTLTINSGVAASIDGALNLMGDASVDASGAVVVGATGSISGTAMSAFRVAASGNVSLTGGASLSGGTITVNGGLAVVAGTTAVTVSGMSTTTIGGSGSFSVNGRLDANSALMVSSSGPDLQVKSGGDFRIAGGVAVTLKSVSFDTNSDWYLSFDNSGSFRAVNVSGNVTLGGRFHLALPAVEPRTTVRLVTAAGITGTFNGAVMFSGGAAGRRRLLGSGSISVSQNAIDYHPANGAASLGLMGVVLGFVLALF